MLKFLEKHPFTKWKFLQRIVHRQRNRGRSETDKFKTFDTSLVPKSESINIVEHDETGEDFEDLHNETDLVSKLKISLTEPEKLSSGQYIHDEPKLRRCYSDEQVNQASDSEEELPEATSPGNKTLPLTLSERVEYAKTSKIKAWEKSHGMEVEPIINEDTKPSKKSPLSFSKASKLRTSLRDLKRKSMNHMDSMKRRVNTHKYDNLEDPIVELEKSPRLKHRQLENVGKTLRRSFRRYGGYAVKAMSDIPPASLALGLSTVITLPDFRKI